MKYPFPFAVASAYSVESSRCSSADYLKESDLNVDVSFACVNSKLAAWDKREHDLKVQTFSDNRATFKALWGKPHFYFRGSEFYFHGWKFKVRLGAKVEYYYVLTAKGKGTCYERTGNVDFHTDDQTTCEPIDKKFFEWLESELTKVNEA